MSNKYQDAQGAKYADFFDPPEDDGAAEESSPEKKTNKRLKVNVSRDDEINEQAKLEESDMEESEQSVDDADEDDGGSMQSEKSDEENIEEIEEISDKNKKNEKRVSFTSDLLQRYVFQKLPQLLKYFFSPFYS